MPYDGPLQVIESVLVALGIDPRERVSASDQDPEYTACNADELEDYYELYRAGTTSVAQRAVLACFMLESLNDFVAEAIEHPLQREILEALVARGEHADELAYWSNTTDPDEENWFPLTKPLIGVLASRGGAAPS